MSTSLLPARKAGFTVIEILTTLSILMLLMTSGVPSFQSFIKRNQHAAHVNQFVTHLHYTRSEAIKRNTHVIMCRGDESGCKRTEGWHKGWIVFADPNNNRELDTGENVLQVAQGWDDGILSTSGQRRRIRYREDGSSTGTNGTYVFCHPDFEDQARAVILSNNGRPRLSKKRPDGSPLTCS